MKHPYTTRPAERLLRRIRRVPQRFLEGIGGLLERLGAPGAVANLDYDDAITGHRIRVTTGAVLTCLSVDGREYYFRRLSGRFDGTGITLRGTPGRAQRTK